jgi:hypothetical protein
MIRISLMACAAAILTGVAPMTHADELYWTLSMGVPGVIDSAPESYPYQTPPVYLAPPPVYVQPPVYYGYGPAYQVNPPPVRYERRDGWRHRDDQEDDDE